MQLHDLVDLVEKLYVEWRFCGHERALEGSLASYFHRAAAELDRRRRRDLVGTCTCMTCMDLRAEWSPF
jgi:hypothetical protein